MSLDFLSGFRKTDLHPANQWDSVPSKMTTLSTGFDYFGICDIVLPPALTPIPAPVITPHRIGQWRTYRETSPNTLRGKEFVSVYRENGRTGYLQRRKKTQVQWYGDKVFRDSYSNQGAGFILRLMPEGHAPSPV